MLQVFDLADPNLIVGKRDVTTVPTQALFLMNNPFVLKQAEEMARRVLAEKGLDQGTRIAIAYRLALGRLPTDEEKATLAKYLEWLPTGSRGQRPERKPATCGVDQSLPDAV